MTHSDGLPHGTGDREQRYMVETRGYPLDKWQSMAYTDSLPMAKRVGNGFTSASACEGVRIIDRVAHRVCYEWKLVGGEWITDPHKETAPDNVIETHVNGKPLADDSNPA